MEENVKNLWLSKIRSGKVAVIESHYAPNNTSCIWLKDGVMYAFGNSGWESIGGGNGGGLPVTFFATANESEEQYANLWFYGQVPGLFVDNNMHLNTNTPSSPSIFDSSIDYGIYLEIGTLEDFQNWYSTQQTQIKTIIDSFVDKFGSVVQVLIRKESEGDTGYPGVLVFQDETSGIYTAGVMFCNYETVATVISEGKVELAPYDPH